MFGLEVVVKASLLPPPTEVFSVIEMLIMSLHAQIDCVKLLAESSDPEVFKVGGRNL